MKIGRASALVVLLSACATPPREPTPRSSDSKHDLTQPVVTAARPAPAKQAALLGDDDYAIYEAVLRHQWIDAGRASLVVRSETADACTSDDFEMTSKYLRAELSKQRPRIVLEDEVLESYRRVRAGKEPLEAKRFSIAGVSVASPEEMSQGPQPPRSGAVITLSRIGFASSRTRGLLSASSYCGGLCGAGYYIVVEKVDGRWHVAASVRSWVA